MTRQRLPIGIQSFARLRETDSYYVDKTPLIRDLVERGDHWFLSRPRRFGKSLLVDTIKALFEGQEALFRGLAIHGHWDWSVTHPVVRLSFDRRYDRPEDIERSIANQLGLIEHAAGLEPLADADAAPERLQTLLYHLHHKTGQRVVILVDEYDKPILDILAELNWTVLPGLIRPPPHGRIRCPAMRYPSWVTTRKLPVTDSAMASHSRGRVSLRKRKTASVNCRKSAWNRLRLTWRCMTPHNRPVGFRCGA